MVPLVNSALGRLRPKDHEFQASLGYLQDPVTKQNERLYSSGWVWADVSSLLVHNVLQETLKHHTVLSITSNRVKVPGGSAGFHANTASLYKGLSTCRHGSLCGGVLEPITTGTLGRLSLVLKTGFLVLSTLLSTNIQRKYFSYDKQKTKCFVFK